MSQERFDHKVKKKLESVKPPFQEEAWQKFRHLLPLPWYLLVLKKYGGWLYGGLTTVALVGTSYLYMQERSENEYMRQSISTQQATNISSDLSTAQPSPTGQVGARAFESDNTAPTTTQDRTTGPTKTDTVYLVQKIYVDRPVAIKDISLAESTSALNHHRSATQTDHPVGVAGVITPNAPTNKPATQKDTNQLPVRVSGLPASGAVGSVAHIQDTSKTNSIEGNIPPSSVLSAINEGTPAPNDITHQLANKDNLATTPPVVSTQPAAATFILPSLHTRFGVAADIVGFQRFAVGPTAELFLGERLSMGAGLHFSAPIIERLGNPREFNQRKGRRFEDQYRDRIPKNDRIADIKLTTKLVRVPISLQYYFPTNGHLAFILMGGTTLDIYVQQQIDFQSSFQGQQEYNRFQRSPAPNTLNNVLYGVGLQYTLGKWVGQLMPYYNYQLSEPDYRDTTPKVGISATVKIDIGK